MPEILTDLTKYLPDVTDWLIYGAIAVVTLIGVIKCLLPLWNTTHALRSAVRRLQNSLQYLLLRNMFRRKNLPQRKML